MLLTAGLAAPAVAAPGVVPWIERNASLLDTVDPAAPLDDLAPLRRSVGNASIVALGEPAHEVAEVTTLKHRTLRYLVERMGFRSIAFEDDWTSTTPARPTPWWRNWRRAGRWRGTRRGRSCRSTRTTTSRSPTR